MSIKVSPLIETSPILQKRKEELGAIVALRDAKKAEYYHFHALRSDGKNPDRASRAADIANGVPPAPSVNYELLLKYASDEWAELELAIEIHEKQTREMRRSAARDYCNSIKPAHDAILSRLGKALVEAHEANAEIFKLKTDLRANEIPLIGICDASPHDVLGNPNDKLSSFSDLLADLVKYGALDKMPKSLR